MQCLATVAASPLLLTVRSRHVRPQLQADPLGSTPEQMRDIIKQSLDTWEPVVKARKIYMD